MSFFQKLLAALGIKSKPIVPVVPPMFTAYNVTVSAAPYATRAAAQIEAWRLDRPRRVASIERAASPATVSMSW